MRGSLFLLALFFATASAQAACPEMRAMAPFAQAIIERRAPEPFRDLSMEDARCAQERLVAFLAQPWGDAVGWKISLAGAHQPLRGTIFHATLRATSPARLPARFGAAPRVEAGLLLRVGRDGIASAGEDHAAILRHLDQVIPFIELADPVYPPDRAMTAQTLLSINIGVRLGVTGAPIAVAATPDFARALGTMTLVLTDDRREITRAPGSALLGHPLNAVAWLARDLAREGRAPRAGEFFLLGGFASGAPAEAGRTYTLRHEGLPGAQPVTVTLE